MPSRAKTKYSEISTAIRKGVIGGRYGLGERLPTRTEMAKMFGVSLVTIQSALGMLARDGFVRAHTGSGTFVADCPPYLHNYGLVIPAAGRWSRAYAALAQASKLIEAGGSARFREYYVSESSSARDDVAQLVSDARTHCLAGLVLVNRLGRLNDIPKMVGADVPMVVGSNRPDCNIPTVRGDYMGSFISRAVEYLWSKGRCRIAHLVALGGPEWLRECQQAWQKCGVQVMPHLVQAVPSDCIRETASGITQLLMRLPEGDRPDGLIVYDDNLVEEVAAGMVAAGVKVPEEVEVVAHFNHPGIVPCPLPFKRLGFDSREWLRVCIETVEMQRKGVTPPAESLVPAVFEDELVPLPVLSGHESRRPTV
jgi:DNA-binding LacI/PurR family transcriptional regulator